jgi:hypothetical protein
VDTKELMDTVCPQIRDLAPAFYFTPETLAVGKDLGLGGLRFYFLGRGGVLGDVEPEVVLSAFGYFSPSIVAKMWNSAKAVCAPRHAGRAFMECSAQFGREHLAGLDNLEEFCAAAGSVNDTADPVGLALYAGVKAEPLSADLPARAMQLLSVLRELRGSAHLLAVRASGLDSKTAHYIKRPGDMEIFGWTDEEIPSVTDADRSKLAAAERLTDELLTPAYSVLDDSGRIALVSGIEAIGKALSA